MTLLIAIAVPASANGSTSFRAQGNEPSWSIRMSDGEITFQAIDSNALTINPVPVPRREEDVEIYETKVGADPFVLTIASKICTDTMSGMPFPKSVTLVLGDKTFSGCGGEPASLLQGQWAITGIDGKRPIAGSSPTVNFDSNGKLYGNASCNQFFGGYAISGEGLAASDLGASMMMCEQALMDQELGVLSILKDLREFRIGEDRNLILRASDGRTITAEPAV